MAYKKYSYEYGERFSQKVVFRDILCPSPKPCFESSCLPPPGICPATFSMLPFTLPRPLQLLAPAPGWQLAHTSGQKRARIH